MRTVCETQDREALHRFLCHDRITAAYQLGDLDPRYFSYCRWWASAPAGGDLDAVLLLYAGLRMPAVLTLGSAEGLEAILDRPEVRAELPGRFYVHILGDHMAAVQSYYRVDDLRYMVRMGLAREDYAHPEPAAASQLPEVTPITHADTAALMSLYRYYPDSFFEPYQLEGGFYCGMREGARLLSVAGTHVFSETYDVACLGNVVTHPDHRRKGYSRKCTSVLLDKLFERVSLVALNVRKDNDAARGVYRALGFHDHVKYLEGMVSAR